MPSSSSRRLTVEKLGKCYNASSRGIFFPRSNSQQDAWGLKDVSFNVSAGERVAVVGRNGSGKSTLLKLISRVLNPTSGRIKSAGRIASMLEVGCGFHPDLSGLDNVLFTAALLGRSEIQVRRALEEILDFAQLAPQLLEQPVLTYSNGMRLRLAFATSTQFEPEILIVDETLTVGDYDFQQKCLDRLRMMSEGGCTILAASHSPAVLRELCQRGLLLEKGRLELDDDIGEVLDLYLNGSQVCTGRQSLAPTSEHFPLNNLEVVSRTADGQIAREFQSDQQIEVALIFDCIEKTELPHTVFLLNDEDGQVILASETKDHYSVPRTLEKGRHELVCSVPPNLLGNRRYLVSFYFGLAEETIKMSRVLAFNVSFKGYHSEGLAHDVALLRPRLVWGDRRLS